MKHFFSFLLLFLFLYLGATQAEYSVTMFPLDFEKQKISICENYPAQLEIFFKGNAKKYMSARSVMTLDLPEFITLTGVCEWNKLRRDGVPRRIPAKITKSAVKRGALSYNRYQIAFDSYFNRFMNQRWYRTFMVMEAAGKSAGKSGKAYWSFDVAGDKLPETNFDITILPPVQALKNPCKEFTMLLYYRPLRQLPYPGAIQKERNFWDTLSQKKI
jgi:hypothetical protein